jgi:hypothetical protein
LYKTFPLLTEKILWQRTLFSISALLGIFIARKTRIWRFYILLQEHFSKNNQITHSTFRENAMEFTIKNFI